MPNKPHYSQQELEFPPQGTLWEAFKVYAELRLAHKAQDTWRQYVQMLRTFERCLGRYATPEDLTDEAVVKFETWLNTPTEDGRRRAERTTQVMVERLLAFWTWAAHAAYVDRLPAVRRKNRWETKEGGD